MTFMTIDSPGAFQDIPKRWPDADPQKDTSLRVECPRCHGHGKFNLELDAYGKGRHFQSMCGQCNGWGSVVKGSLDETCIHERREVEQSECRKRGIVHHGMCWHVNECKKCGQLSAYDSSG